MPTLVLLVLTTVAAVPIVHVAVAAVRVGLVGVAGPRVRAAPRAVRPEPLVTA